MTYKNGKTATFATNCRVNTPSDAIVFGTKGCMCLKFPFWCADKLETSEKLWTFPLPESKTVPFNFHNSAGLGYEAQHVRECLQQGLKESPVVSLDETLLCTEIMETIRKQVGVHYEQDD